MSTFSVNEWKQLLSFDQVGCWLTILRQQSLTEFTEAADREIRTLSLVWSKRRCERYWWWGLKKRFLVLFIRENVRRNYNSIEFFVLDPPSGVESICCTITHCSWWRRCQVEDIISVAQCHRDASNEERCTAYIPVHLGANGSDGRWADSRRESAIVIARIRRATRSRAWWNGGQASSSTIGESIPTGVKRRTGIIETIRTAHVGIQPCWIGIPDVTRALAWKAARWIRTTWDEWNSDRWCFRKQVSPHPNFPSCCCHCHCHCYWVLLLKCRTGTNRIVGWRVNLLFWTYNDETTARGIPQMTRPTKILANSFSVKCFVQEFDSGSLKARRISSSRLSRRMIEFLLRFRLVANEWCLRTLRRPCLSRRLIQLELSVVRRILILRPNLRNACWCRRKFRDGFHRSQSANGWQYSWTIARVDFSKWFEKKSRRFFFSLLPNGDLCVVVVLRSLIEFS